MNSSNLSVLVHTFDKYRHLWQGCINGWQPIIYSEACKFFYFGTDLDIIPVDAKGFEILYSGPGEWSDRLIRILKQIPTDYVLYAQEDHWPTGYAPNLSELMEIVSEHDLFRLQISTVNRFYKLEGAETLFFDPESKYLVSHQPSIWKKSFLLECLKPNETPWENEYRGTQRLQKTSQMREYIRKKIAIYPCDWYKHMCVKGKVVES